MFEREITLNRFMLDYYDRLVGDITDEEFTLAMPGGGHSPQWIVGHLITVADSAGLFVGLTRELSRNMRKAFGPGQAEQIQQGEEFSRSALTSAVRPIYDRLCEAAAGADEAEMQKPHNTGILAGSVIETRGEIISHVLTTHIALHLGQLSAWRRIQGRPAIR